MGGLVVGIILMFVGAVVATVWKELQSPNRRRGNTPTPRRSDPMQALLDPTDPDHVRWTVEVLDRDYDGVIEDWEMDGSIWD